MDAPALSGALTGLARKITPPRLKPGLSFPRPFGPSANRQAPNRQTAKPPNAKRKTPNAKRQPPKAPSSQQLAHLRKMTACGAFAGRLVGELVIVHYFHILWIELFQERARVARHRSAIFISVTAMSNGECLHCPRDTDVK